MSGADAWLLFAVLAIAMIAGALGYRDITERLDRLECIHYVYEDGSAVHEDAELASRCIEGR